MPTTLLSTNDLLKALEQSALSAEDKNKFEGLLNTMTDEEKGDLEQLINEANQSKNRFESEKGGKLSQLNQTTAEKLNQVEQTESRYVRTEMEKFDQQQTQHELVEVEHKLEENSDTQDENQIETKKTDEKNDQVRKKSNHLARNFILILLGLALVAIALIFGLSNL